MSDSTFDAPWLALREPVDHRSRSEELATRLVEWWGERDGARVLDLGSGTGSNLRYLAPRLGGRQEWTLLDHDAGLLARVGEAPQGASVEVVVGALTEEAAPRAAASDLVTASALLDLVSAHWIEALADACREAGCAALFALTYDGTVEWRSGPAEPLDEVVCTAVNEHQRRDKGVGRALGPEAGPFTEQAFLKRGFETFTATSPWHLGTAEAELARALLVGWGAVAEEQRPEAAGPIGEWAERRHAATESPDLDLVVGHVDLLCLPG